MKSHAIIGMDPSLRSFGLSDGAVHVAVRTPAGIPLFERVGQLLAGVKDFVSARGATSMLWAIEAPLLSSAMAGSHLYELGWVMCRLYLYAHRLEATGCVVRVIEIPSPSLRKWALGKGNVPKESMSLKVFQKFGVEFADDRGCDKLFAYLLHRYGAAVFAGDVQHVGPAARGSGAGELIAKRHAAQSRSGVRLPGVDVAAQLP